MQPTDARPCFRPGEAIAFREVWRGEPWSTHAVTVVADGDGRTALYRPIGAPGMVPTNASGRFRRTERGHWFEPRPWTGTHLLMLHDWGEPWSTWCMWDADWRHTGWYVNLEEPWRRAPQAIETMDHELDIVVGSDGSWQWKDEERLAEWVAGGAHTPEEAAAFRHAGERVISERIEPWGDPFNGRWTAWRPDPGWSPPGLPAGWRDVAAR